MSRLNPWLTVLLMINNVIILGIGLKYLFNSGLMPYHKSFIGQINISGEVETLITMGLRMIGACFIALSVQSMMVILKNNLRPFQLGLMFLVCAMTASTTYIVGYLPGTIFFVFFCILQIIGAFVLTGNTNRPSTDF